MKRVRLEYFDQNDRFASCLPRTGNIAGRFTAVSGATDWYLVHLDQRIAYELTGEEACTWRLFETSAVLIRSRWAGRHPGGGHETSVSILLVHPSQMPLASPLRIEEYHHVAWGMCRTLSGAARATSIFAVLFAASVLALVALLPRGGRRSEPTATQDPPVVMVDPRDLLFSRPTLADRLPDGEKREAVPADAFHLHEDDWRQLEFVGLLQQDEVEAELGQLRSFIAKHRKGLGFTQVYVRRDRPDGLAPLRIERAALEPLLPPAARRHPLVVGTAPWGPRIVSGYAIEIGPEAVLYVQLAGRHLVTMGLPPVWRKRTSTETDAVLIAISRTLKLRLVDWPAATWVDLE